MKHLIVLLGLSILTIIYFLVLTSFGNLFCKPTLIERKNHLSNSSSFQIQLFNSYNNTLHSTNHLPNIKIQNSNGLLLVVGILSKLDDFDRRRAIRFTWMQLCTEKKDLVICRFFTDSFDSANGNTQLKLRKESDTHKDIVFMPYKGGHNFALRLVWMMNWYSQYDYNYFLRVDDDYFICLNRLLNELPYRPKKGLYWGYIHCRPNIVRVDEGWLIISKDIVEEALSKENTTLQCHPFGDQAVAIWILESKLNVTYFLDNDRIIHAATAYRQDEFLKPDICQNYLSLHGSYPIQMLSYWILSKKSDEMNLPVNTIKDIPLFHTVCGYSKNFNWQAFGPGYRFEPKPCNIRPVWDITNVEFVGRERDGHEASY